jgi:hypothetical protein
VTEKTEEAAPAVAEPEVVEGALPEPPDGAPKNVIEALARVMDELPGVGKDSKAPPEMGGYAFRGIEAITRAAQHLVGQYGLVPTPKVLEREVKPVKVGGKDWMETTLKLRYVWKHGPSGTKHKVGPLWATAFDNSDKGNSKAMTMGYKQMLLQTFLISDGKEDPDQATTGERDSVVPPWQYFGYQDDEDYEKVHNQVSAAWAQLTAEQVEIVRAWLEEKDIRRKWPLPADVADALFDRLRALAAQETPQDGTSQPVAATAPVEPSVAPSGSSEPPEAPTPARAPSSRDLERLAKTPEQAQAVLDRAIREVAILSASAVSVALGERQLSKAGNNNERRRRLAAAMAVEDLEKNPDADVVPMGTELGERIAAAQATSFRQPAAEGEEPPADDQVPEEHEFGDPGDTRQLDEAGKPVADDSEPF